MRGFAALRVALAAVLLFSSASSAVALPPAGGTDSVAVAPESIAGMLPQIPRDAEYMPGEVLVRFRDGVAAASTASIHARAGATRARSLGLVRGLELAKVTSGRTVAAAVKAYEAMPEVLYAQPNYIKRAADIPDDPKFALQWALDNTGQTGGVEDADIDAPEAWAYTTGTRQTLVAVIDTGVDLEHPELAPNIWTNVDEVPDNGVDDDLNGYVDDVHGYDVFNGDGSPMDDHGHGTHVAGIIGAVGDNGVGVAGTDWNVSIIAVKMLGASGVSTTTGVIDAFAYVRTTEAKIVNCSWGGSYTADPAERDAITAMGDRLFVFAAGNETENNDTTTPFYPASYDLPNILSVGASTASDAVAPFSNWGAETVDVFAPGNAILSTAWLPRTLVLAPGATTQTPMFSDTFDSLTGWQQYRWGTLPYQPLWAITTGAYASAPSSAAITGYVNNQWTQLRQKLPLDLTATDFPTLRFRYRADLEPSYDYLLWGVVDQSAATMNVLGYATGDTGGQFQTVMVDLSPFVGQNDIQVFFTLVADDVVSSAEGYDGAWIDDVDVFDADPAEGQSSPYEYVADFSNAYVEQSGTSMAAPYVTGIAALMLSRRPSATVAEMKAGIMDSAEDKPAFFGKCQSGGRVNALGALAAVNAAPAAQPDSYATAAGTPLAVPASGVLGNDSDSDGDGLRAEVVTDPAHGQLMLSPDGSFTYTPSAGFTGVDSFTYRCTDGLSWSAPATVTLAVDQLVAVFRFYNKRNGSHFYTASAEERDIVIARWSDTYDFEGTAYVLNARKNDVPLYRFYNGGTGSHFYTASAAERDTVMATWPDRFAYEGPVYNVSGNPAYAPVYRFYNLRNGSHFYTASAEERDTVAARWPDVYQYEGTAFYLGQ